jgi:hypothetical protein
MKIDPRTLLAPLVGVLALVVMLQQTLGALRASGAWRPENPLTTRPESPYARLDALLSEPMPSDAAQPSRNPFEFGSAPLAGRPSSARPGRRPPPQPQPPPQPVLTAIIWDEDPRATVRYGGRDFSVRVNSLFAEFTVKSIRPTEVVLDRNGQPVVLRLRSKGE